MNVHFVEVSGHNLDSFFTALYRTQLPVHRKLIQWLLGTSPSLSATRDRPTVTGPDSKSVWTRSEFIQLTVVDDVNAKAVEA